MSDSVQSGPDVDTAPLQSQRRTSIIKIDEGVRFKPSQNRRRSSSATESSHSEIARTRVAGMRIGQRKYGSSMLRTSSAILGFLACVAMVAPAQSHTLSPCLRVLTMIGAGKEPSQAPVRTWNRCGEMARDPYYRIKFHAVHEHMTLASILVYRGGDGIRRRTDYGWKYEYLRERPWQSKHGKSHETSYLMYGTWWNDDPLMLTWGQGWGFLAGSLDAIGASKNEKTSYDGGTENCQVPAAVHLGRASHRGHLQYLHFMTDLVRKDTTPQGRVASTTKNALRWMEFAYKVATGEVKPDAAIPAEDIAALGLPSVAENHCMSEARVWTLFTRVGWPYQERTRIAPDVAIGSMLHVLQDSFSPAHTCRIKRTADGGRTFAVLHDVYNYKEQNAGDHTKNDDYPSWLVGLLRQMSLRHANPSELQHEYQNDPVKVGAWLLDAVDRNARWEEVQTYLRTTAFRILEGEKDQGDRCI